MKKIFTLIAALAIVGTAAAQKTFTFGPKVGMNFANLHSSDSEENDDISGLKPALVIGGFVEYRAANWFAVSADVLYSRKGALSDITSTVGSYSANVKNNIRLSYIDVPIMANFYVTKGLALKTGVQPSFLAGAKVKNEITVNDQTQKNTRDVKDYMKSVDFAIPVGISYSFNMGLMIDLRYNIACSDIIKDKDAADMTGKITNQVATLSVGWKF